MTASKMISGDKMNNPTMIWTLSLALAHTVFAQTAIAQTDPIQSTPDGSFCIANASDQELFFVTETREGTRNFATLATGGQLCSVVTQAKDGIVGVFHDENALEGCSRIIGTGTSEAMLEYAEFDRCGWSSHNQ